MSTLGGAVQLKGGFSFCTLFFGYIYVFYRKMWLLGFIWLLISILLYNHFWIALGLNVFIAFCFKEIYLSYVDGKVRKIKEQYSNYSGSQLVYICSKKGGTTIIPVIISVIIGLLIPILSTVIVLNTINDDIDKVDIMQEDTIVIDQNQW